jgi:hypothetical protein
MDNGHGNGLATGSAGKGWLGDRRGPVTAFSDYYLCQVDIPAIMHGTEEFSVTASLVVSRTLPAEVYIRSFV